MKEKAPWLVLLIPIAIACFVVLSISNTYNPDSWFCCYEIYKTPSETYQVVWSSRSKFVEWEGATYEEAKRIQIQKCKAMLEITRPKGKRIK
jgi:hypothetical protein